MSMTYGFACPHCGAEDNEMEITLGDEGEWSALGTVCHSCGAPLTERELDAPKVERAIDDHLFDITHPDP